MTPIERAARALWELKGRPSNGHDATFGMILSEDQPGWEQFVPDVLAVLKAIREPNPAMYEACVEERGCDGSHADIYRAMIDSMLEESPYRS